MNFPQFIPNDPSVATRTGKPHRTWQRRDVIGTVLARLGSWFVMALVSFGVLVNYWFDGESLLGPDPFDPEPVEKARSLLVWATILFAVSVLLLVSTGAPRPLRVIGIGYAVCGALLLGGTWLE